MGTLKVNCPLGTIEVNNNDILNAPSLEEDRLLSYFAALLNLTAESFTLNDRQKILSIVPKIQLNPNRNYEIDLELTGIKISSSTNIQGNMQDLIKAVNDGYRFLWVIYLDYNEIIGQLITALRSLEGLKIYKWNTNSGLENIDNPNDADFAAKNIENLTKRIKGLKNAILILEDINILLGRTTPTSKHLPYIHFFRDLYSEGIAKNNNLYFIVMATQEKLPNQLNKVFVQVTYCGRSTPLLDKISKNLNVDATQCRISPLIGREDEIKTLAGVIKQRKVNNAILVGRAGTGKTQIVHGFAQRIAEGKIPELKGKVVYELDLNKLMAESGGVRGGLESAIARLMHEVKCNKDRIIIFIDEIHRIMDDRFAVFRESLLPALNAGEFPLIGATTDDNYGRITSYEAFERRFVKINIRELTPKETVPILKTFVQQYKKNVDDNLLLTLAKYAKNYISENALPSSAVKVLMHILAEGKELTEDTITEAVEEIGGVIISWEKKLNGLEDKLKEDIVGQDEAIKEIAKVLYQRVLIKDGTHKPIVLLFAGPTGVGKTQTAISLADKLFGPNSLKRFDMGEFHDKSHLNRFFGAPPAYVGHEEGGGLTNWLRDHKSSVVLFDEIEKAHPEIYTGLMALFDTGRVQDATGKEYDGSHAIYVMTSNLGAEYSNPSDIEKAVSEHFPREFISRIDKIIVFKKLEDKDVNKFLERLIARFNLTSNVKISLTDEAKQRIIKISGWVNYGIRRVKTTFDETITEELGRLMVNGQLKRGQTVKIGVKNDSFYSVVISKEEG